MYASPHTFRGLDRSERSAPVPLVIFPGVLNLGDADAGGTLAGEPQQFIAGDFITQFLGNQGRSIGAHGLQHLLPERRISGDVSKKLPELVRAHATGDGLLILTGLFLLLCLLTGAEISSEGMTQLAVSGASGKTGWRVVEEALKRGQSVRAIVRPGSELPSALAQAEKEGLLEVFRLELDTAEALLHALQGCTALVIATGARPSINLAGPLQVDAWGVQAQVQALSLIHISEPTRRS